MGNIWTVARQTLAEAVRMKVAVLCIGLLAVIIGSLPFVSKGDGSLSGAVQSFLQYSVTSVSFLLACASIFLAKSLSDDLVGKQILMLMTKPIARWQYVLGKWLGIMLFNVIVLSIAGATIYGMTQYLAGRRRGLFVLGGIIALLVVLAIRKIFRGLRPARPSLVKWLALGSVMGLVLAAGSAAVYTLSARQASFQPRDEYDAARLNEQILLARHAQKFILPINEFAADAKNDYERNLREGRYAGATTHHEAVELKRLRDEQENQWRAVQGYTEKEFRFADVRVNRSPDEFIHLRYNYRTVGYPPDEIIRLVWVIGDPEKGTAVYGYPRRDVLERRHTLEFPADAVAEDNTLLVTLQNYNPFAEQGYDPPSLRFEGDDAVEVLFAVGSFGGNLVRALTLVLCRLAFIAGVAVMVMTIFSFPVACLVALTINLLAVLLHFIREAISWIGSETIGAKATESVLSTLVYLVYMAIPNFAEYDGLPTLVDGRNVTLVWVMHGLGILLFLYTGIVLLLGCLMFHRRQVAEISV